MDRCILLLHGLVGNRYWLRVRHLGECELFAATAGLIFIALTYCLDRPRMISWG